MTFSVVARCAQTGMFGMAVSSSSPAVAARCAHARAGVGVAASQNVTDPVLGARALELLSLGLGAQAVVDALVASTPHHAYRQLAVVDACGATAAYSGDQTLGVYATAHGRDVVCSGNLLANESVPREMVLAFEAAEGALGDRVMASLKSGLAAGGEAGPVRSAGLLLVREVSGPVADLRVDWHESNPIAMLDGLWALYAPQLDAYVTRALAPTQAPGFAVPGEC